LTKNRELIDLSEDMKIVFSIFWSVETQKLSKTKCLIEMKKRRRKSKEAKRE
jgi:hypothetical protein